MQSIRAKLAGKQSKLAAPRERMEDHPADLSGYQDGSFYQVDIDQILPDPQQPRKYFDPEGLKELSESIRQKGVLQPIIIRKSTDSRIFLVAGERRYRAAKMAGMKRIPAILTKGNAMEIALIENLQREDLKPIEEAEALARLVEKHGYSHSQLATILGKGKSTITEILSLNRLPEAVKEIGRRADRYPRRLLIEVAKQKTPEQMMELFQRAEEGELKSDQIREIARSGVKAQNRTPATIALEKIYNLNKHLNKFNLGTASESQRLELIEELKKLKATIDKIFR